MNGLKAWAARRDWIMIIIVAFVIIICVAVSIKAVGWFNSSVVEGETAQERCFNSYDAFIQACQASERYSTDQCIAMIHVSC